MRIEVIHTAPDFLVINKPAGMLAHHASVKHKTKSEKQAPALTDWLLENYPEVKHVGDEPETRPGIVHRLDKDTSGIILVARTQEAFAYFKKQFQTHSVQKTYLALVYGVVKNERGTIEKPIGLKSGTIKRTVWTKKAKMVKEAVTDYKVEKRFAHYTLLAVMPKTGRTHQIRVHLAAIGHPVVGDALYGKRKAQNEKLKITRQFLHAYTLAFTAPDGKPISVTAELPPALASFVTQLAPADS